MAKQTKTIKGRVIKAVASKFFVDTDNDVKVCFARKKLKFDGNIFVGDYVEIAKDRDVYVIESVEERKGQVHNKWKDLYKNYLEYWNSLYKA